MSKSVSFKEMEERRRMKQLRDSEARLRMRAERVADRVRKAGKTPDKKGIMERLRGIFKF